MTDPVFSPKEEAINRAALQEVCSARGIQVSDLAEMPDWQREEIGMEFAEKAKARVDALRKKNGRG